MEIANSVMPKRDLILFAGMMGTGKSTVGVRLARKLKWNFVDLDEEIEVDISSSISSYISSLGEQAFRSLEAEILKKTLQKDRPLIVALGGGTLISMENQELVRQHKAFVIWLDVNLESILVRLTKDTEQEVQKRPLLKESDLRNSLKERMDQRRTGYELSSNVRIDCSNLTVDETVDRAMKIVLSGDEFN